MTVYIDTNTFSATPMLYGDADKKKPLPRVIPSVLLNEGIVRIGFLGDYAPTAGVETVCAVASIPAPGNPLRVLTSYGTQVGNLWEVPINFDATEIADALVNRGSVNLSMGIIVEGADVRREYQFWVQCFSSAQGEISPEETADAKTFADAARLSADNAAESESNAAQSATDASESAAASAQSASAAATSASNAATSASNAKASETNAATSATNAAQSASDAAQSKTAAANSASAASTSATNASNSASAANTSAGNASNSATAAATSANNAAQSASAAKASEDNAKASETASKASETASANSASSASTSATNASNSASSASTSATNAGNSAVAAAGSAEQAAQSAEALANVYTKPQIDGVDTGAEVTLKMNEIIAQLKEWEEVTGVTLDFEFWEALMEEFQNWQANPEFKNWNTTSETQSTNPYRNANTSETIIAWNLSCKGTVSYPSFGQNVKGLVFLSGVSTANCAMTYSRNSNFIFCDADDCFGFYRVGAGRPTLYLPNATTITQLSPYDGRPTIYAPKAKDFKQSFYGNASYNQPVSLPSGESGGGAFTNSGMSAENISATLDSLPEWTDGAEHIITFTGCPGAAELTQDSPSVAAAVAKGWTVQL